MKRVTYSTARLDAIAVAITLIMMPSHTLPRFSFDAVRLYFSLFAISLATPPSFHAAA